MGNILRKYNLAKVQWEVVGGAITGDTLPIGSIIPFGGTEAPTGWLICDGSMLNRTTYKELFAAIGTNFGTDGPGNFYIPDLRGKVVVGQDTTDSDFGMGATGGEKKHTLTVNEMPSHNHTLKTRLDATGFAYFPQATRGNDAGTVEDATTNMINNTGGSQPHNNLQPYQVTNYIIKAFQSSGVVAQVSNTKSTSTTDTYSCEYQNKTFGGISLYTGGSNANITLSDSAANYTYLEIFFNANNYYNSVKVYSPNNKNVYLSVNVVNADASYFQNKIVLINGTSISNVVFNQNTVGSSVATENANNIYITKVIGYK